MKIIFEVLILLLLLQFENYVCKCVEFYNDFLVGYLVIYDLVVIN